MTPEDVLLEAIAAASLHGDSPDLRRQMCHKLAHSMSPVTSASDTTETKRVEA